MTENYTPAMRQYIDLKKQNSDCILFFRLGDFYEVFFEDAKICSKALDLVLTSKNKNSDNPIPMAGVPYHSADKYIQKLVQNGYKIAIAEQMSDPIPGKIVERQVVSIITPGTYIQEKNSKFNYIVGITFFNNKNGQDRNIAWGDFSIGEYWTKTFDSVENLQKFILTLNPSEIVFDIDFPNKDDLSKLFKNYLDVFISVYDLPASPKKFIENECSIQTISSFGQALENGRLDSFALLLHYIKHTQKSNLGNINRVSYLSNEKNVLLDDITIKNLEIFFSSYENSEKYSLFGILNNTKTGAGSRLLSYLLSHPINDFQELNKRFSHIEYYQNDIENTKKMNLILSQVGDVSKYVSSILYKKLLPSTFVKLRQTLHLFYYNSNSLLEELLRLGLSNEVNDQIKNFYKYLYDLLKDDGFFQDDINYVREGFDQEVDRLRQIVFHSDELLLDYQRLLSQASGVTNVKVKFVMNQGYFIEITNKDIENFEKIIKKGDLNFELYRRNTLKGGQRYSSAYLENIEKKILNSRDELIKSESALLQVAKNKVFELSKSLNEFAQKIAWLDVYSSQAILSQEKKYCKPEINHENIVNIQNGRHPVIEEFLPLDQQFIPNNLEIGDENDLGNLHIITGPNMGGKSTYLRQNALIVLLTHCGLFVPANSAKISLVDGIFARVGSGDVIANNQSTFMTEMIEVSNILNNASSRSFVIFDELGRGTSTYDGLSLTKAILEFVVTNVKCKTLIATHYHELIAMEKEYESIKNHSVSVYETDKEVVFMKKIVQGGANKSYGIDVAKLAGIPIFILEKARNNLNKLENGKFDKSHNGDIETLTPTIRGGGMKVDNLFQVDTKKIENEGKYEKVKSLLENYDLNNITPLQALQILTKLKEEI